MLKKCLHNVYTPRESCFCVCDTWIREKNREIRGIFSVQPCAFFSFPSILAEKFMQASLPVTGRSAATYDRRGQRPEAGVYRYWVRVSVECKRKKNKQNDNKQRSLVAHFKMRRKKNWLLLPAVTLPFPSITAACTRAVRDSAHQHNPNADAWRLCSAPTQARQYVCIFVLQMSSRTRRHVASWEAPSPPQHERKRQSERGTRSR